jgi:NADH:ubiquinone oxidoreductase subunit 4 (subunit M)
VEAPTPGSVLLAGVILKLGSYGVIRYIYEGPFITITDNLIFVTYLFALIGFIYCAFVAFNQPNMKKVIAYSSVSHMNFALLGLLTGTTQGYSGMVLMMMAHGIAASGLFICLGVLYDKHKSLIIYYYGGFAKIMPVFSVMFFFLVLANIAFPGTFNFVGELLLTLGIVNFSLITGIIVNIGLVITLIYSLTVFTRIFCGVIKNIVMSTYCDASRLEAYSLILFVVLIVGFGLYPDVFIKFITTLLAKLFT